MKIKLRLFHDYRESIIVFVPKFFITFQKLSHSLTWKHDDYQNNTITIAPIMNYRKDIKTIRNLLNITRQIGK